MEEDIIEQTNHGKNFRIEPEVGSGLDSEKLAAHRRWEAYIAAMRGYLSSHPMDTNKVDTYNARLRAEERFFADSDRSKAKRRAFLIQLILSRVAPSYGG